MTAQNPPFALQNAGATHTAAGDRMMLSGLISGISSSGSGMRGRQGVTQKAGKLKVQAQGSPAMAVDILSGQAYITGTENTIQGVYSCVNDATVSLAITTAHATLPRIDIVIAQVQDTQYSGAVNAWSLVVVAGTPAASPVAPTAPNNSIVLANVLVGAGVTSIVNGNITDTRQYVSAEGGVVVCTSTTRPNPGPSGSNIVFPGQLIYESDTDRLWQLKSGLAYWPVGPLIVYKTADESLASSITMQNDDHIVLPVDINATYLFKLYWLFQADNALDIKFQFTLPAGAAFAANNANALESWNPGVNNLAGFNPATSTNVDGGNTTTPSIAWGSFTTAGTAGNIQLQWAQQVSGATPTIVRKGTWLELTRIA